MLKPGIPADEKERVAALRSLHILDTPAEERFDRLTRIAKRMFGVSVAEVSLIDSTRQWIKSTTAQNAQETPRDVSFCGHTILGNDVLHVQDAAEDERFFDNPLVVGEPKIRFYAGYPIRFGEHHLGALCLIDRQPRSFSDEERRLLADLAHMAEEELTAEHIASTDEMTGLANRRGFEKLAQQVFAMVKRVPMPLSLVYFDLNRFKEINDEHGHAAGDQALRIFAEVLRGTFRESDLEARIGGDEFAVILTNSTRDAARTAIERMRQGLDERVHAALLEYPIVFSAGIVEFDEARHETIDDLLEEADAEMYREKMASRSR